MFIEREKLDVSHLIMLELKEKLRPSKVIFGLHDIIYLDNDYPILMFDDIVTDSYYTCNVIDMLQNQYLEKLENPLNNKFVLITAILSCYEIQALTDFNAKIYTGKVLPDLMPEKLLQEFFKDVQELERFMEYDCRTSIYCLPLLPDYRKLNERNRETYNFLESNNTSDLIENLKWSSIIDLVKYY